MTSQGGSRRNREGQSSHTVSATRLRFPKRAEELQLGPEPGNKLTLAAFALIWQRPASNC